MLRARSNRLSRARMALWEAPITATVWGWQRGRCEMRSLGLRTRSRSSLWMFRLGTGTGRAVGDAPVQRMKRGVLIWISSGEP